MTWIDYALQYARNGWPVVPLYGAPGGVCACPLGAACKAPGKHPTLPNGVKGASLDPAVIQYWSELWPDSNVGIAIPPGLAAVDVDPRNRGAETLAELEAVHGELPVACSAATGGGGLHILVRLASTDDALPAKLGPGVDVKQYGGYIVAAPSVHASGQPYRWLDGRPPEQAPEWIQARSYKRGTQSAAPVVIDASAPALWTAEQHDAIAEILAELMVDGQKHYTNVAFGGWCKQRGATVADMLEIIERVFPGDNTARGAVTWAFRVDNPTGYTSLANLVGADAVERLGVKCTPAFSGQLPGLTLSKPDWSGVSDVMPGHSPAEEYRDDSRDEAPKREGLTLGRRIDLTQPLPDLSYPIDGMPFHLDAVNGIIGYAGDGKSPLTASLVVALASGIKWFNRQVQQGRCLVLAFEAPRPLARTIQRHARAKGVDPMAMIDFLEVSPSELNNPAYIKLLRRECEKYRYVILDTYNAAVTGVETNDSAFAAAAKNLEMRDKAVFCVLHTNKGSDAAPELKSISGSGAIAGALKAVVGIWRPPDCDAYTFEIVCVRQPDAKFRAWRYRWDDVEIDGKPRAGLDYVVVDAPEGAEQPGETKAERHARLQANIVTAFEGKPASERISLGDLVNALHATTSDVKAAAKTLCELGKIREQKRGKELGYVAAANARKEHLGAMAPPLPATHAPADARPAVLPMMPVVTHAARAAPSARLGRLPTSPAECRQLMAAAAAADAAGDGAVPVTIERLGEVLGVELDHATASALGSILKACDYTPTRKTINGQKLSVYGSASDEGN